MSKEMWFIAAIAFVLAVGWLRSKMGSREETSESAKYRYEKKVLDLSAARIDEMRSVYREIYDTLDAESKVLFASLDYSLMTTPLADHISATSTIINSTAEPYHNLLIRFVDKAIIRSDTEIVHDTIEYGRHVASLHGIDLKTFETDIDYFADASNPELLISIVIILLSLGELHEDAPVNE